jgi:peptidyl-dipeptidase A
VSFVLVRNRNYSVAQITETRVNHYGINLFPDLSYIIATSTDWDELLWAWQGWRDASGKQMPDMYQEFVGLLNEAARLNGGSYVCVSSVNNLLIKRIII